MACILIIDDQPVDRSLLMVLLGYHGYTMLEACDGVEGLALTISERPDLVITDMLMPGMDGYEFARRVRANPELAGTRIMFYTATYLADEVRRLAAAIGGAYVLTKPAEPEHLLSVVRAALSTDLPTAPTFPDPPAELDREYLRLLTNTLHNKVEQLKAESRARALAEQALQRSNERVRHLREIDQSILAGRPLPEIAQAAIGHLWDLLDCTRVSVVLADLAAGTITLFATQAKGALPVSPGLQAPLAILGEALDPLMRGQIYQVPDLADLPEPPPALRAARVEQVRGYCYVPIIADAELIGLLGLGSGAPGLFSAEQLDIAREAAGQLSIALWQARLQDRVRLHAAELERRVAERTAQLQAALAKTEVLYTITRAAIESEQLADALQQVVDRLAAALHADRVALIVFDQAEQRVMHFIRGGPGFTNDPAEVSFDELMERLNGWPERDPQSILAPKGAPDQRESLLVRERRAVANGGAIAMVPLRYLDRVLGTLTAINLPEQPDFSAGDLELMEAIAGQAASTLVRAGLHENLQQVIQLLMDRGAQMAELNEALTSANAGLQAEIAERARLEDEIRKGARRAQALAALSKAVADAGLDQQVLFETITQRVSALIGDACVLMLISEDGQWLNPVAFYHPDPDGLALLCEILPTTPYPIDQGLPGQVVRTGVPALVPVVPMESYRAQLMPEHLPFVDRFGITSLLIVPIRAQGRIVGTLGVARNQPGQPYVNDDQLFLQDLADRAGTAIESTRLFGEVQQAREAAERADLTKTEFLSHMSHELRTPLNAIIGFTGTLLMRLPGPLNADQEKQLNTVQSSARHLLSLINDLLDLAKIQSGKIELHLEPVVCQEVLGEVAANLRLLAEQKGLRFDMALPAEQIMLQTDRRALSQIIINLANNAIKFTDRGSVYVALRRTTNGEVAGASLMPRALPVVEFAVRDTGIGIRTEDQVSLFEAFTQARPADSRRREGTGLGLHLSQQLAELLGGSIEYTSQFGQGSLFTLLIPER
jgi:signal transduction histidine kinase/DNA-binding response OmpR family regulator